MLRIIAGEYRSRLLATPEGEDITRPWTGRAKESVFNLLRGWFEGARVLDLFAGVGSMGLEAASRGATEVVMVERSREVLRLAQANIDALGCGDRVRAVQADALGPAALAESPRPLDVLFVDPPYAFMEDERRRASVLDQVARCRELMAEKAFVVLRSPIDPSDAALAIEGFAGPEVHRYGAGMYALLYMPRAQD
ncbi:MAG: RsmD family RNA methyltransferase [Phycisphaerales bacterium]|nr:RsmD family RNA methyltransferase [Phycisphaerales bacterium]